MANFKPFKICWKGGPGRTPKTELDRKIEKTIYKAVELKIGESTKELAKQFLDAHAFPAAQRLEALSAEATKEEVQLSANKDILDRVGVGTKNTQVGVAVQVNFKDPKYE